MAITTTTYVRQTVVSTPAHFNLVLLLVLLVAPTPITCDYDSSLYYSYYNCTKLELRSEPSRDDHGFKIKISENPDSYVPLKTYTSMLNRNNSGFRLVPVTLAISVSPVTENNVSPMISRCRWRRWGVINETFDDVLACLLALRNWVQLTWLDEIEPKFEYKRNYTPAWWFISLSGAVSRQLEPPPLSIIVSTTSKALIG